MDHGWTENDAGNITTNCMIVKPAPELVLQELSCKCKRKIVFPAGVATYMTALSAQSFLTDFHTKMRFQSISIRELVI